MTSKQLMALVTLLRQPQCPVDATRIAADILETLAKEIEK